MFFTSFTNNQKLGVLVLGSLTVILSVAMILSSGQNRVSSAEIDAKKDKFSNNSSITSELNRKFEGLSNQISHFQTELKSEINSVKSEINSLKSELIDLDRVTKKDLAKLDCDINNLYQSQERISALFVDPNIELNVLKEKFNWVITHEEKLK